MTIIFILLYGIAGWIGAGLAVWAFKMFFYFHGVKNCIEWMEYIYRNNQRVRDLLKNHSSTFVTFSVVTYITMGPLAIFDFINVVRSVRVAGEEPKPKE